MYRALGAAMALAAACLLGGGCGGCGGSKESRQIRIVCIADTSGPLAEQTAELKHGILLALGELERRGRTELTVRFEDSKGDLKAAARTANEAVTQEKAQVLLVGSDEEAQAVVSMAERRKTVVLAPTASAPELSGVSSFFFRIVPSEAYQARVLARRARRMGILTGAVLYVRDGYGIGLAREFMHSFEDAGGRILARQGYLPGEDDFRTSLTRVSSSRPDMIFLAAHAAELNAVMGQLRELRVRGRIFGADAFEDRELWERMAGAVQGVVFALPVPPSHEAFTRFAEQYRQQHGKEPGRTAAAAYDAIMVLAEAAAGRRCRNGKPIRDGLRDLSGYIGVTGPILFDDDGDPMGKPYTVNIIRGREIELLEADA